MELYWLHIVGWSAQQICWHSNLIFRWITLQRGCSIYLNIQFSLLRCSGEVLTANCRFIQTAARMIACVGSTYPPRLASRFDPSLLIALHKKIAAYAKKNKHHRTVWLRDRVHFSWPSLFCMGSTIYVARYTQKYFDWRFLNINHCIGRFCYAPYATKRFSSGWTSILPQKVV